MTSLNSLAGLACATLLLTGCASASTDYPNLAMRDTERLTGTFQPVAPSPGAIAPTRPVSPEDITTLVGQARQAHDDFQAAMPGARGVIGRAGSAEPGTDAWAEAQVSLADLETNRSRLMVALADLDELYVAAASEGRETSEIDEARSGVTAMLDQETDLIGTLHEMLSR